MRGNQHAICATLADAGKTPSSMADDESLWQAAASPGGLSSGTFYARFRSYLAAAGLSPTGLHVLRHTAAKMRRDAGESVEAVSAFLDHSSLAVTTVYLRRLEGVEDRAWSAWRALPPCRRHRRPAGHAASHVETPSGVFVRSIAPAMPLPSEVP